MKTVTATLALLALMLINPASLLAGQLQDGHAIHGKWEGKAYSIDGETEEIPEGVFRVEFMADGKMKTSEEGEETIGTYKIEGDKITFSEDDSQDTEEMNFKVDGDKLEFWTEEDGVKFKLTLARIRE